MSGLIHLLNSIGVPSSVLSEASFYVLAVLVCVFAFLVVTSRNVFHSAVYLALALIGVAGIYLYLNAEFLAVVQVLIYVGAVVTLFIFAIMLTARIHDQAIRQTNEQVLVSAVVTLALLYLLINIVENLPSRTGGPGTKTLAIGRLGELLMKDYALPFEVISLVLLAALVGAIVIGKEKRG